MQDPKDLKTRLTSLQYHVTQEKGTERPFTGEYTNLFEKGTYNCIVCDTQLYASEDKYDHGCGWPAFGKAITGTIEEEVDNTFGMRRVEVHCKKCGAHQGHVFNDGPAKFQGVRYCVNSASINFKKSSKK